MVYDLVSIIYGNLLNLFRVVCECAVCVCARATVQRTQPNGNMVN